MPFSHRKRVKSWFRMIIIERIADAFSYASYLRQMTLRRVNINTNTRYYFRVRITVKSRRKKPFDEVIRKKKHTHTHRSHTYSFFLEDHNKVTPDVHPSWWSRAPTRALTHSRDARAFLPRYKRSNALDKRGPRPLCDVLELLSTWLDTVTNHRPGLA